MKRRFLLYAFVAAITGVGCSVLVSYDGYGDGVRGDDGGGTDGTIGADGNTTNEGGNGSDASIEAGADATIDALDGGPDGTTNKKYAVVLLGGESYNDAGVAASIANVEYAMINADGTLGPWITTTPMTDTEDRTGAAAWGSSVFVMDDFGTRVAVMQADGGLSSWTTLASINRNSPQLVALEGRLYVAGGEGPGSVNAPEVYYATITGPLSIGAWTPTSPLSLDGGPRNDTTLLVNNRTLYLVGGDHANVDIASVISAPIDNTGAVGTWTENTPLPTIGDHLRATFAQGHLTIVGGSFDLAADRGVYTSAVQDAGVLGSWQMGSQHPDVDEPTFFAFANYAYLIGGRAGTTNFNTVYYAPIQANGFPGTWQNTTTIKVPRHDATAVVVEMP